MCDTVPFIALSFTAGIILGLLIGFVERVFGDKQQAEYKGEQDETVSSN